MYINVILTPIYTTQCLKCAC